MNSLINTSNRLKTSKMDRIADSADSDQCFAVNPSADRPAGPGEEQAVPKSKAETLAQSTRPKGKLPTKTDRLIYQRQSEICKAFAHPVRIQILDLLGQRAHYVSELLEELGVSKPNLSQHLAILRNSGAISTSRVGKHLSCTLTMPEIKTACELIRNVLRKQIDAGRKLVV